MYKYFYAIQILVLFTATSDVTGFPTSDVGAVNAAAADEAGQEIHRLARPSAVGQEQPFCDPICDVVWMDV